MRRLAEISAVFLLYFTLLSQPVAAHVAASTGVVDATQGKVWALVVGISDFAPVGEGGPDLEFADDDALAFVEALQGVYGVPRRQIRLLLDSEGTKANILEGIAWLAKNSRPNDDIVYYSSGHGTFFSCDLTCDPDGDGEQRDNAILTHDLDFIWDGDLRNLFMQDDARRKVIILDISFPSGFINDLRQVPNLLYIAAATGEAFEVGGDIQHGVFTWFFVVRGILRGEADDPTKNPHAKRDGSIPLEEAFDFASHAFEVGVGSQKPNLSDNVANDILLNN